MIAVTSVTDRATVRRDIVTRATDYVLERGLNDLSLRPLAAALGTSARMLVYYFGSKERLILDLLAEVRQRKYAELEQGGGDGDVLRRYWRWATSPQGRAYLRLVYEVFGRSLREPERFGAFAGAEATEVVGVIAASYCDAGLRQPDADALATYTFAALRGLELDLLGTGDLPRVERAFAMLAEDIERRAVALGATRGVSHDAG